MGMIINPFGVVSAVTPITLGNPTQTPNTNLSVSANFQLGAAYLAATSGTLNFITICGSTAASYTANFRLCIYEVDTQTSWNTNGKGALLGQTAQQTSLAQNSVNKIALLAPVNPIAGSRYAITIQADTPGLSMGATLGGVGMRFSSDTYSDGAAATVGVSGANSTDTYCLLASTT